MGPKIQTPEELREVVLGFVVKYTFGRLLKCTGAKRIQILNFEFVNFVTPLSIRF